MNVFGYAWKDNATVSVDGATVYTFGFEKIFSHVNSLLNSVQSTLSKENASELHARVNVFKDICSEVLTGWADIVLAISCDGWPSCAKEWITRDRIWPQTHLIQKIINDGFHIVPKSSTEGDFRLSFSYAETTLIESLSKLQHKVLRSFKAVVKFHQSSWSPNIKEIITTYHLKTIAFWYFGILRKECRIRSL